MGKEGEKRLKARDHNAVKVKGKWWWLLFLQMPGAARLWDPFVSTTTLFPTRPLSPLLIILLSLSSIVGEHTLFLSLSLFFTLPFSSNRIHLRFTLPLRLSVTTASPWKQGKIAASRSRSMFGHSSPMRSFKDAKIASPSFLGSRRCTYLLTLSSMVSFSLRYWRMWKRTEKHCRWLSTLFEFRVLATINFLFCERSGSETPYVTKHALQSLELKLLLFVIWQTYLIWIFDLCLFLTSDILA